MRLASFISFVAGVASALQPSAVSCSTDVAPGPPLGTTAHANSSGYSSLTIHGDDFVPDYVLDVTYQNISVACQSRLSAVVNGTSPGPALRIPAGKTTWIRVYNSMSDYNLTMHWHGLSQRLAAFSDGTPSASQWPIAPSHFFDYAVHPEAEDAGTYFYHSHIGFQAVSAAGALIVEDTGPPPYTYDEERLILLSDYFNKTDDDIEHGLTANPFVWSGETSAVLINGVGVAKGEVAGRTADCSLPVIHVEPGKTYRWRFIGSLALSMVQFGIVGHDNLTIIAADGQYTLPHTESYMQITSGQRFDTKQRPQVYYGYGILRYSNKTGANVNESISTSPATPPLQLSNVTYDWLEYALEPLKPNGFPTADEVTRRVYIYNRQVTTDSIAWQLNGLSWKDTANPLPNDIPYLVNIYGNGQAAIPNYEAALENGGWDNVTSTWPAKIGEVLEIIHVNTGSLVKSNGGVDYHPFHAHGKHYYDIGSGNGTYDPAANELKLKNYNPVLRDTTNLYRYETTTTAGANAGWRGWRLRVVDPGVWLIHCHILQHMVMGMQSVWVFGDAEEIQRIPHYDAAGYLEFRGSAYGNQTFAPSYVNQWDD